MRKLVDWQGGGPLLVEDDGTGNGMICLHGLGGGSYFFSGHMIFCEAPNRLYDRVINFLQALDSDWDYTY